MLSGRVAVVVCVATTLVGLMAPVAQAREEACSKTLIHDWYKDGQIQGQYRVICYRAALADVPHDMIYGEVRMDLSRALSSGIARVRVNGAAAGPQTLLPAPSVRVALPATSSRSESHAVLVFAALASLTLLLLGWFLVRRRNFRLPR